MDLALKPGKEQKKLVYICEGCRTTRYGTADDVPKCHRMPMVEYAGDNEGTGSLDHIHW